MAGSFGQFRLPTTRPWQRPITLLGPKTAKHDGGRMSTRLLAQQRIDALDKHDLGACRTPATVVPVRD